MKTFTSEGKTIVEGMSHLEMTISGKVASVLN
jgi:hypothetical protein